MSIANENFEKQKKTIFKTNIKVGQASISQENLQFIKN